MRTRKMRGFSLSDTVVRSVQELRNRVIDLPDLKESLGLGPIAGHTPVDHLGLSKDDYALLQSIVGQPQLTGESLITYALINAPIGTKSQARRCIRAAQIRSRRQRAASVISVSRVVEALLLKGLETINAGIKSPSSKGRNVRKVA